MKVNGYDENFDGWGWEERDFKNRVIKFLGIRDVQFRRADLDFISHENTFNRPKRSNLDNKRKSRLNMENERYIVNTDIDFGSIDDLKITGGRSW
jgi:hypothetical protein